MTTTRMNSTELDKDSVTHCTRCGTSFENFYGHRVDIYRGDPPACREVICEACDRDEMLQAYRDNGELCSRLVLTALLAEDRIKDGRLDGLREDIRIYYTNHGDDLLKVAEDARVIWRYARRWELKHWLGEDKLQGYYRKSEDRGHGGESGLVKVLMWGSAGRVLLTIQDKVVLGSRTFRGAWITLIFSEDSTTARGGVQGQAGTLAEILGLLEESSRAMPKMKMQPDEEVSFV